MSSYFITMLFLIKTTNCDLYDNEIIHTYIAKANYKIAMDIMDGYNININPKLIQYIQNYDWNIDKEKIKKRLEYDEQKFVSMQHATSENFFHIWGYGGEDCARLLKDIGENNDAYKILPNVLDIYSLYYILLLYNYHLERNLLLWQSKGKNDQLNIELIKDYLKNFALNLKFINILISKGEYTMNFDVFLGDQNSIFTISEYRNDIEAVFKFEFEICCFQNLLNACDKAVELARVLKSDSLFIISLIEQKNYTLSMFFETIAMMLQHKKLKSRS